MEEAIKNSSDIGKIIRRKRKRDGLTLEEASALCGVGYRFLSELENGKQTVALGKVLQVLRGLGLEMQIHSRELTNA